MHRYETAHPADGVPQDPLLADEVEPLHDPHDVEEFLDHGPRESSLTARVAFMTFALALCVVLAVVAAFLVSDKSALRRSDADMFGALADQSALAISAHLGLAGGPDIKGTASVRAELGRLAGVRGVQRVALHLPGQTEPWMARATTDEEGVPLTLGPLPRVEGPSRRLGRDRLVVARSFAIPGAHGEDAVQVVEAGYPGVDRRMRDLVALAGRAIGLTALFLVFLVPIAARILLSSLLRVTEAARSGEIPTFDSVVGGGEEVVTLATRMMRDADLIDDIHHAQEEISAAARVENERFQRDYDQLRGYADAAKREARSAAAAKAAFVANTSHEVRTPLHAVIGTTGLLLETELDAEQRALAERSIRASRALLALVDDVLDLARFDARQIVLDSQPFDPGLLVEEVAELAAPLAAAKGLGMTSFVAPEVPKRLVGDPTRVRQALMRLVDNAIKFTDAGEITVDVGWETWEDGEPRAAFTVTDTGLGIADDARARLFQAFEQLDTSNTRRHGGVGLGLALVARIARAAGGEVRLESRRGFGSSFRLALPFESQSAETQRALPVEGRTTRALDGVRILLLDDAPVGASLLARTLGEYGATVTVEASTYAGFEALLRNPHEVVLLDSLLPGRDAFLGALESNDQRGPVPVALMTPAHVNRLPENPNDEAVSAVASKPLSRVDLVGLIERALGRERSEAPAPLVRKIPEDAPAALLDSDVRRRVRILLVEDNHTNQQLVQYVLGKRGYVVDVASNGRQAVDAFTVGEYDAVLMDCQMPEMDGFEATKRLRVLEAPRGKRTPILAMTASSLEGDRDRCIGSGMDDMIAKPFQPHQMIAWLESWLVRTLYDARGTSAKKPRASKAEVLSDLAAREQRAASGGGGGAAPIPPAASASVPAILDLDPPPPAPQPPRHPPRRAGQRHPREAQAEARPVTSPPTAPAAAPALPATPTPPPPPTPAPSQVAMDQSQAPRPQGPRSQQAPQLAERQPQPPQASRPDGQQPPQRRTITATPRPAPIGPVQQPRPSAPLPSRGTAAPSAMDLTGALDRDVLASLFDDEEGRRLAVDLVQSFFELAPDHLRSMEHAVEAGDLGVCASIAHKFVSTSGTVGAIRLAQMLREVEQYASRGDAAVSARLVATCREETDRARRALRATFEG